MFAVWCFRTPPVRRGAHRTAPEAGAVPNNLLHGSGRLGDGEQTLAEGWADEVSFECVDDGKNEAVKNAHGFHIECAFLQHAKIQPPNEIADGVEIIQAVNGEAGGDNFFPQFRLGVAAEMAEVLVNRRVKLGARGNEEAEMATLGVQALMEFAEFGEVIIDVFEHVHADDGVGLERGGKIIDGALDDVVPGKVLAELFAEFGFGLDGDEAGDGRECCDFAGELADASADFHQAAF